MPTATDRILGLTLAANGRSKVALDTCCVRYFLEDIKPFSNCLTPIFQAGLNGIIDLYVSTVVVSELLAFLIQKPRDQAGYDPDLFLTALINQHFSVIDVDEPIARTAGRLRGNVPKLKTPDALIGATSLSHGHTIFITNDTDLARALPNNNCIFLRDAALEWLAQNFPQPVLHRQRSVARLKNGPGLPRTTSLSHLNLGCVKPASSVRWQRILTDATTVASAINEPCAFFVLSETNQRKQNIGEVLFWHRSFMDTNPSTNIIKRLREHLGYSTRTGIARNRGSRIHGFIFTSLTREKTLQNQPYFASKHAHTKEADAWNDYLTLFRTFRSCLDLPQTTWLLCEDGAARLLDIAATVRFLNQAKNVLGWKDET